MTNMIRRYRCPERILLDRGTHFKTNLVEELCLLHWIKMVHMTPYQCYHPLRNKISILAKPLLYLVQTTGLEFLEWWNMGTLQAGSSKKNNTHYTEAI